MKILDINQPETGPDYLGTGLADALITRLSAIRSFAVRPTSSVLRYGADADPLRAGRELGVDVCAGRQNQAHGGTHSRDDSVAQCARRRRRHGPDSLTSSLQTFSILKT
jgi:hypothetical protein